MTRTRTREFCVELTVTAYVAAHDPDEARDLAEQLSENLVLTDRAMCIGRNNIDDASVRDVTEIQPERDEDYLAGGTR